MEPAFVDINKQIELARQRQQAGDSAGAEKIYREILARQPGHPQALHRLATVLGQRGKFDEALELAGRAVRIKPDDPNAHKTRAAVLASMGRFDDAIKSYHQIVKLWPGDAVAHRNLGAMLASAGRLEEAAAELERATHLNPNDPWAFNELGTVRIRQNRFEDAIAACRKSVALNGGVAETQRNLGDAYFRKGMLIEAQGAYSRAIELKPGSLEALCGLARVYDWLGRFEEALAMYAKAAAAQPDFLEAHARMAVMLASLQRFDEALACQAKAAALNPDAAVTHQAMAEILLHRRDAKSAEEAVQYFRKALAINPGLASAWNDLGLVLRSMGKLDEAADCFRKLLELQPNSPAGYYNLAGTGAIKSAEEIQRLMEALEQPNLGEEQRVGMEYALGSALDDAGRNDEAFAFFARANATEKRLRAATGDVYDPARWHQTIDKLIETFTPAFFAERQEWGKPSEIPVFVVGMPRSGTTLVQQIAASHPQVHGAGELWEIGRMAENLGVPSGWTPGAIESAAGRQLQYLRDMAPGASRIIDKMPSNILQLGLIAVLFPQARVVLCQRDPRDTCLSCFFQRFRNGNTFSFDLANCGHCQREMDRLAEHWRRVLPLRMIDIQYEAVVADLEGQSRRLIEFLGLPWDPACLEFHRSGSTVLTASAWQVRQPIYTRSVGRWRRYEKHLGPLLERLKEQI
jgi:tetratricopeptide (TPR) repeat protein